VVGERYFNLNTRSAIGTGEMLVTRRILGSVILHLEAKGAGLDDKIKASSGHRTTPLPTCSATVKAAEDDEC